MNVPSSRGSENRKYNPMVCFSRLAVRSSSITACIFPIPSLRREIIAPVSRTQRAMHDGTPDYVIPLLVFRRNYPPPHSILVLHNLRSCDYGSVSNEKTYSEPIEDVRSLQRGGPKQNHGRYMEKGSKNYSIFAISPRNDRYSLAEKTGCRPGHWAMGRRRHAYGKGVQESWLLGDNITVFGSGVAVRNLVACSNDEPVVPRAAGKLVHGLIHYVIVRDFGFR